MGATAVGYCTHIYEDCSLKFKGLKFEYDISGDFCRIL